MQLPVVKPMQHQTSQKALSGKSCCRLMPHVPHMLQGLNGLRSAWLWHSQGRPAALTSGSEDCHINNAGLMSRSGSMSSMPHGRKEDGPDLGADLSSKSTSTPAGLIPPKASNKATTVSLVFKAPALRTA